MSRSRLIALVLALITLAVFLPAGRFGFVNFDDNDYVTGNPFVKHGLTWGGVKWAFTAFYSGNWHPVTWLSHMADCELFGLNAGAHHFVNVLFHAANAALLFVLLGRLTQKIWPSALVAALFAWHPLHVESVAWIAERKDVLSTFFALLAMLSYTKFVQYGSRRSYWLALLFFVLGLMSKPMLVTLPCVMLLLDFWPLRRISSVNFEISKWWPPVVEKIPFFVLTAASCIVTFFAQKSSHAVASLAQISPIGRLANAVDGVAGYLQKLLWPADLCIFYQMPEKIPVLQTALAIAALLLIFAAAWRWRRSRPYFLMGWLWFLGTLAPVSGLVQVGGQAMADRYAYIPSIGFFIALVFLADEVAHKIQMPRIIRFGLAGMACVACILTTEHQLQFWRDTESLFRRAVDVNPKNDIALIDLGVALDAQGRFEEALDVYFQAVKSGSRRYEVYNNLGNVLGLLGRHDESISEYRVAIKIKPNPAAYTALGRQLAALGRYDEALKDFAAAETLDPNYAPPHVEAARALFKIGRDAEGVEEFQTALRIEPDNYQTLATAAHYLAANENAAARDGPGALALALKADQRSGHIQPMVLDVLGMALAENGDFTNAATCARQALALAKAAQMKNTGPLQARLEFYTQNQPWRESFRATNAPVKN